MKGADMEVISWTATFTDGTVIAGQYSQPTVTEEIAMADPTASPATASLHERALLVKDAEGDITLSLILSTHAKQAAKYVNDLIAQGYALTLTEDQLREADGRALLVIDLARMAGVDAVILI